MPTSKTRFKAVFVCFFIIFSLFQTCYAEINFDFGLTLFGQEEVKFEQSKTSDFNFQLLKKYIHEKQDNIIAQLHVITRWFSLIKLSDKPRRDELIAIGSGFFDTQKKEFNATERVSEIFYKGILLSNENDEKDITEQDEIFENLILDSEDKLSENGMYWIVKGLLFSSLQKRSNAYFALMKPEEDLKHALTLIPQTAHYYYIMGQAFRFISPSDTTLFLAVASYEKAASLDPRNGKLQNSLLGIYMGLHEEMQSKGKPEPFWLEEAVYKKILEISPNNAYALNNLGFLYAEYGINLNIAQELCQRAVHLAPENPIFRDSLGWAAFKNKNHRTAETELKQAIRLKPDFYEAHYHLATVYYANERPDKAAQHYETAIKLNPEAAEALNNLAYLYAEQDINTKAAVEMAEKAITLEANNASYLDTHGWAHYRAKNYKTALTSLLKANELAPGQGEILLHIGRVYLDCNKFTPAIRYLKEAFKVDPQLKDPDNSLYLAVQLHAFHTALANYHNIMDDRSDKEKIHKMLLNIARLYQEEKVYDKAIEITRVCADFKAGKLSIDKPLLPSYVLKKNKPKKSKPEIPAAITSNSEDKKEPEQKQIAELGELPDNAGQSLAVAFGPALFKYLAPAFKCAENFSDKSITVFISKLHKTRNTAIIRIESAKVPGMTMLKRVENYMKTVGAICKEDVNSDKREFQSGKTKIYAVAHKNSIYISRAPIDPAKLAGGLDKFFTYSDENFIDVYYSWPTLIRKLPRWTMLFFTNPIAPFTEVHSKYTLKEGNFNEYIIATTGKIEPDNNIKKYARELFIYKLTSKKMGLETTIKLSTEQDKIYTEIDYHNAEKWLTDRLASKYNSLNIFFKNYIKNGLAATVCFVNRLFYAPDLYNCCPHNGKIFVDLQAATVSCETHNRLPIVPIILDERQECDYNRMKLFKLLSKEDRQKILAEKNNKLLIEKAKELAIPLCNDYENWELRENEIICPSHKN